MKKFIWIPILCLLLLCGCTHHESNESTATTQTVLEDTSTSAAENTKEDKFPNIMDIATVDGFVTTDSLNSKTPCQIYLRKYRNDQPDWLSYDLYIEVDTGPQVLKKELETQVSALPEASLFTGDVDGDGIQEILVHSNTGGMGGFGVWETWVLNVEDNDIRILFKNFDEFDTGFESRFLDGYQMEVKNKFTGYTLVYDVKERHREYINSSDKMPSGKITLDPFYIFEPKDMDDDGICEILCEQYTSCIDHADYTGKACSVLKFNKQTQVFEVIDAWYEPNMQE